MLNPDALKQLQQLKQNIEASKDYAEGVVRGTQGRFGFVMLDDGREAFLPPDEMQQVLPGDRVKVSVTEADKQKKLEAKLEKLLSSELKEFVGRYMEKGPNHFIVADHPQLSRWLFVPPKSRKQNHDGNYVLARLLKHPFPDGKAQAGVLQQLGKAEDPGIERKITIAKFNLPTDWPEQAQEQCKALAQTSIEQLLGDNKSRRLDLTHLPFATVDAESTQDMDDALHAEVIHEGDKKRWRLMTAIADVSAWIPEGSPLDEAAKVRANSIYFPGASLPMFPNDLSHKQFSLLPGEDRLALVCQMEISEEGDISAFEFSEAIIRSHHKLSYTLVNRLLAGPSEGEDKPEAATEIPEAVRSSVALLADIARARREYRGRHCLVQDENVDFYFVLNKQQKIERIERKFSTEAHRVVEEAMLATNLCAAETLAKSEQGLFSVHRGFRKERINDVKLLLSEFNSELPLSEFESKADFVACMQGLAAKEAPSSLIATLRRLMQPGELSAIPDSHCGLGFDRYAMATSPIRRYQDLHNHRLIRSFLRGEGETQSDSTLPATLQSGITSGRQACRSLEQWLCCIYMEQFVGQEFAAKVSAVSNQGLGIKLEETGIESFIPLRNSKELPLKFDSGRMTLQLGEQLYRLEQPLRVNLLKADVERRQLQFVIT